MNKDPWHFPRTSLANQVLGIFTSGLSSALTFFAPRRMGKTEFLRKDITPAAEADGWRVFYYSFLDADPSAASNFTQSLAAFSKGDGWFARAGKTLGRIAKISGGAAGVSADVELKEGKDPEDIKTVIGRLAASGDRVLLLLDEVQALATPSQNRFVAALRTALDMHKDTVKVIFTGSSREGLRRMFSQASAPFFHFGQNLSFPPLERSFTDHLATAFNQATQRQLDQDALWRAFEEMGHVPQLARSLVERLALNHSLDIADAKESLVSEINISRDYAADWNHCSALERLLLTAIANADTELYSAAHREGLARALGVHEVPVSSVQSALRSLARRSLIFKQEGGNSYEIEDPMFREWLMDGKQAG